MIKIFSVISLIISILSFSISFFSFKRYSPKIVQILPVDTLKTRFVIPEKAIYYYDDDEKRSYLGRGFMVRFNFLNSTSRDIAFFHSCFYVNNELKELYTNRTVAWNSSNPHFIWNKGDSSSDLIFPDNVNGIFKANSLTPFYAYIPLPENESVPKKITFSIKIAVRRFPYITIKQQYTEICYEYDLTNFSIELLMVKNKYTHNNIERYKTKQMLRKQEELKAKRRPKKRKS